MHANPKDVNSEHNESKRANKKGPSRLTISQGVANIEIFGTVNQSTPSVEDQGLPISQANLIKIKNSNEMRAAQAAHSQLER
jgi:hypothetical protein